MGQFDHVVVVGYGRSAVAKSGKKGALRNMHPVTMGGLTLKGVLERVPQLPADQIDDLIVGCAIPERKQGFNMARLVAARAGLPDSVCGMTINRFCSSGLQAIALAAGQIACGVADVMVAGGVESMTACPVNLDISDTFDPDLLRQREEEYMPMGLTAENVAARYGITRQEMDELALQSHRRAAAAQDAGKFDDEIIPLPGVDADGDPIVFDKDQGIRRSTTLEALAGLKPCFKEGGLVTAATSSQTSDAAAFVVLMRDSKARCRAAELRRGRLRAGLHGPRPHLRRPQGAGKGGPHRGRYGRGGAERSLCGAGYPLHENAGAGPRQDQSQRRRYGTGSSPGRYRCLPDHQGPE